MYDSFFGSVRRKVSFTTRYGLVVLALCTITYVVVGYWSYIFSKTIYGTVLSVERVTQANSIIATNRPVDPVQLFSFAVSLRDKKGSIWTAAGEDRQWAVVKEGQCIEARFYPYPPWDLAKSGTYANARLIRIFDCDSWPL